MSVTTTLSKLHDLPEHFGVNKPATKQQYLKHLHVFSNYSENVTISNCCCLCCHFPAGTESIALCVTRHQQHGRH